MQKKRGRAETHRGSDQKPEEQPSSSDDLREEILESTSAEERVALDGILKLLFKTSNIDFAHYRQPTILRRLSRRISMTGNPSYAAYLSLLRSSQEEADRLFEDLLLSHTEFFRDPFVFEALGREVFPRLANAKNRETPIRLWIAGCSTGEEVYSLAIALQEFLSGQASTPAVQIFGTDLNERNILAARRAIYSEKACEAISAERLNRFFDRVPEGFRVAKGIREICVFAVQDITQDPPFPSIDLISCRNVLIYFDPVLQDIVIPLFHFSLNPKGHLLLGTSESMSKYGDLFAPVDQQANLYARRQTRQKPEYRFRRMGPSRRPPALADEERQDAETAVQAGGKEQDDIVESLLLETFAPPSIVVDGSFQIRKFRGDLSSFVAPSPGEASLRLSKMAIPGIMPEIYVMAGEAKEKGETVRKDNVSFQQKEGILLADIRVIPFLDSSSGETCFIITFEEKPSAVLPAAAGSAGLEGSRDASETEGLREELAAVKSHLQSLVEDKDSANQELWAANEEIQSTNEELQSVNEELEAAKEELEASNEELRALNEELQTRNAELRTEKDFSESLIDTAQAMILLLDQGGAVVRFNRYLEEKSGYAISDSRGRSWFDFFLEPDDRGAARSAFAAAMADGGAKEISCRLLTKDGGLIDTEWSGKVLRSAEGRPTGFLSIGHDVTDRKRAEAALRESEYFFKESQRAAMIGSYKTDFARGTWESSEVLDQIFGIDGSYRRDIQGWTELVHPDDREMITSYLKDVVVGGRNPFRKEYRIVRRSDGKVRWVYGLGAISVKNGGEVSSMTGTIQDITDRKQSEAALLNAQRLESLGILAGGIAHDFNNLLGGIYGYIDISIDRCPDQESKTNLDKAVQTMERARNLTSQLLTFAKGGAPILKRTRLGPLIEETARFALSGTNIGCEVDVVRDLRECDIDEGQFKQVINNLVINSKQAMPGGGRIRIRAANVSLPGSDCPALAKGEYVRIVVEDEGEGIPGTVLPLVFDPFFTTKSNSHGLGLSTSFSIVKRHGGIIEAESAPGKGSLFTIYLPIAAGPYGGSLESQQDAPRAGGTVIVMDDEEVMRETISCMVSTMGFSPLSVKNGEEALDALKRASDPGRPVVAMILDLTIPGGMGGRDVAKSVRDGGNAVPLFVVSGYADDPVMVRPSEFGFTASISKPFRKAELSRLFNQYLGPGA